MPPVMPVRKSPSTGMPSWSSRPVISIPRAPEVESGPFRRRLPAISRWGQNYPNPFNGATVIPFCLEAAGEATLQVFNIRGELVDEQPLGRLARRERGATTGKRAGPAASFFHLQVKSDEDRRTLTGKMEVVR